MIKLESEREKIGGRKRKRKESELTDRGLRRGEGGPLPPTPNRRKESP